ncbi:MAG: HNH endonuclease [Clostridia bacterium]|nr:HNH endonuclease [Clostridia bacterium]
MKSRRAKATDIPQKVKEAVWERDNGRCVVCGNAHNVMPNAHFIPRSQGGLGIEENIVTLCSNLTPNCCHYKFDHGTKQERTEIGQTIERYLKSKYPDWDKLKLKYRR